MNSATHSQASTNDARRAVHGTCPPACSPRRIQRKRTKGWRMPAGAVYVGRGSRFGNPHPVGLCPHCGIEHTREEAIAEFEAELMMDMNYQARDRVRRELAGKTLCCWCRLDQPCHADVLLRVANKRRGEQEREVEL